MDSMSLLALSFAFLTYLRVIFAVLNKISVVENNNDQQIESTNA